MKKNIARIKKFFRRRGTPVMIELLPKGHKGKHSHTHSITCLNAEKLNYFCEVLCIISPDAIPMGPNIFSMTITEDFIICRECGCSQNNACMGGCYWVEQDLCSSCTKKVA